MLLGGLPIFPRSYNLYLSLAIPQVGSYDNF